MATFIALQYQDSRVVGRRKFDTIATMLRFVDGEAHHSLNVGMSPDWFAFIYEGEAKVWFDVSHTTTTVQHDYARYMGWES